MPSVRERLEKIVASVKPGKAFFKPASFEGSSIRLTAVKTEDAVVTPIPEDAELQKMLSGYLRESFDRNTGLYRIDSTLTDLWNSIRHNVLEEYESVSTRCNATKRKTMDFIRDIDLDQTHLANFILQTYIKIKNKDYYLLEEADREKYFEAFEGLRRSYGKRPR